MRTRQRGDGDGVLVAIILLFVLFWGEPDVWDALQKWAKASGQIEAKK
jgi:hypothetical protein